MKLVLVALAVFAVSLGSAYPRPGLPTTFGIKEDLDDFLALIPREQVLNIVIDYLANDAEVQGTLEYIMSNDFKGLLLNIESIPEYKQFLAYLQDNGLNVYYYLNKLHEFLEMPPYIPKAYRSFRRGTGVRGMLNDIEAIMPVQKIKDLYYEKLQNSPAFANLVNKMKGDAFKSIVKQLEANPEFQEAVQRARDQGVDVDLIRDILNKIFGWGIVKRGLTRGLKEDFYDFLALVPKDEIVAIAFDYLANDAEFQEAFEFMQSEDFKNLVLEVDAVPEYIQFLNYLQKNGLNVYEVVNKFHDMLELPHLIPPAFRSLARRGQGVRGFIDDIEATLPIEKIKALYYEKLQSSQDFANLVNLLKGEEFKGMIKEMQANPTFQEIVARAKQHGVDIKLIVDLLNKIFGWGLEESRTRGLARGLKEDFYDFLALVPKDEIVAIAFDYLANDAEVQEAFGFVQSEDFKNLVLEVDAVPEYIQFLNYLQKNGLNVYEVVNKFHDMLELPHLIPPLFRSLARRGQGVRGLIDDIKAILPIEKIKALYYEKLQSSQDFANLVNLLKGDEFKNLIKDLQANPTFQEIVARAKQHGVDIKLIVDLLNKIFGWGLEESRSRGLARGLKEDFYDFLALVPKDEIVAIAFDYLANDAEVQEALGFMQSEDFRKLVLEVDAVPEYIQFLNYLQKNGLNVYEVVNKFHDMLELPHLIPPAFRSLARRGQGVRGLIDDIEAILPIEKIKALYYEKLQSSQDFASLVNLLKGDEFKNMIKELQANPTFQEIVTRAKQHGVDIKLIVELLNKIFGWGLEESRTRGLARGLKEDFYDFLALVPKDEIVAIAFDYLANDAEFQEAFEFMQSEDFKNLVLEVDAVPEYIQFLNYLQKNGLNVYEVVNKFHDMLELPHLIPPAFRSLARRGQGVRGFIDDIEATLPIEKIKALYYEKLQSSQDFANLVNLLKGEEFKGMIKELQANPTFQEIVARAKQHGVDIKLIVDLLNKIFGWGLEESRTRGLARGLKEDFYDFLALVPKDEIVAIAFDYLANDAEFQEAFEFMQSEDFKNLVLEVDAVPEYIQFLNYLQKNGLNVYEVVNKFHDMLELPHLIPPAFRSLARRGQGVRGFIDDIEATLPIEKIKALYYEKLQSSQDFANLVNLLKGEEFKGMIKELQANPTFQEIVARAKQHGVDIKLIVDLLNKIFGWGLEETRYIIKFM